MSVSTEIVWEGPGWYAGSVKRGVDCWIRVATSDRSPSYAWGEAHSRGLNYARHLTDTIEFDIVKTPE